MKRRLNIITMLLLFVFGFQTGISFVANMKDFMMGYNEGREMAEPAKSGKDDEGSLAQTFYFRLYPKNYMYKTDSILNSKTGQYIPMQIEEANIKIDNPQYTDGYKILTGIASFIYLIVFIALIVAFFRLIYAVNKSIIFVWDNIRRLRKIGIYLILMGCILIAIEYYKYYHLKLLFATEHYSISPAGFLSNNDIKMGLIALLVAEIFAIGVRLQEEQELTI